MPPSTRAKSKAKPPVKGTRRKKPQVKIPHVPYDVMLQTAKRNPPPQSWFEETDIPFVVERPARKTRR